MTQKLASNTIAADGVRTVFTFSFAGVAPGTASGTTPYIKAADIKVDELFFDGTGARQVLSRAFTLSGPNEVTITGSPVAAGRTIRIYRTTEILYPLVDFRDLTTVESSDLDLAARQAVLLAQENSDRAADAMVTDRAGDFDALGSRIVNVGNPVNPGDAVNLGTLDRVVRTPENIPTLPAVAGRAGKVLAFDDLGNPVMSVPASGSAADLALTLAGATGATMIGNNGSTVARDISGLSKIGAGVWNWINKPVAYNLLLIGDSNAAGAGTNPVAAIYTEGYMGMFARSLMNFYDQGRSADRGYMYFPWLNGYQQHLAEATWSTSGVSYGGGGPAGNTITMPTGSWMARTGVEASQYRVFYDKTSHATIDVSVNGVPAGSVVIDGTRDFSVYGIMAPGGAYIKPTDSVRFTVSSGTAKVYGVGFLRDGGSAGPLVVASPEGGQTYSDYFEAERMRYLHAAVTADQAAAALIVALFGTNNIISAAGKQKLPAALVADMLTFLTEYRAKYGADTKFVLWVPPRPLGQTLLVPYSEYVKAIVDFCETQSNVGLIRMDLFDVSRADLIADPDPVPGVHYNRTGHAALAKILCDHFGIPFNPQMPRFAPPASATPEPVVTTHPVVAGTGWGSYGMSYKPYGMAGKVATIVGMIYKTSGTTGDIAAVPFLPSLDITFPVTDNLARVWTASVTQADPTIRLRHPTTGAILGATEIADITYVHLHYTYLIP